MIWASLEILTFFIHLFCIRKNAQTAARCMNSWLQWHDVAFLRLRRRAVALIVCSTLWLALLPFCILWTLRLH